MPRSRLASTIRVAGFSAVATAVIWLTGCSTPAQKPSTPATPAQVGATPATESPAILRARFDRLVQELLDVEPELTGVLDQMAATMDKPAQARVEREILRLLTSDEFTATLQSSDAFFTAGSLLQQFTPESAAALKTAKLDRPLLKVVDDLDRLAPAIAEMAAFNEDGRALERIFTLVRHDVLPAVVETRALIIEEVLDNNEASALAQKVEEQLRAINEQLGSLKSRAQSVSSPALPP